MSNSRVIFDIKGRQKTGGGRSQLARYIAESDLDHRREGNRPRPLFTERADALTYWEAEGFITRGKGVAAKDEIKHMVLSLRPRDHELLGSTDEERNAQLREIAREVMRLVADAREVSYVKWYAGIHLNQDNPHIHSPL